ncbi:response regulator transcription factor [Allofournierella massiliensis]|uniref:Stage 0 sporulation protein A homolog n=1 Tax=Allofournierella massiliensis TaxID=1650663 RepID=A0A4R1QVX2_9FIRM|nr:response regulator transcription factor [Fournierella massiliensis]TCL57777.1 DNA-binding response OmpR family regulator [Fournierella massiliensis]
MKPILIVDDEVAIAQLIAMTLARMGYTCQMAFDGLKAAELLEKNEYDLVLLDIMLPGADGYELIDFIRPTGIPVIFISAKTTVADRVKGLHLGACDYIVKPFAPEELLARVENVLRLSGRGQALLQAGDVTVDVGTRQVKKAGQEVALTPTEYHLLLVLLHNKNIALYRDTLYERVWGRDAELDTRTLDIHIHRLRKKLGWQQMIRTIPRVGYRLEETS